MLAGFDYLDKDATFPASEYEYEDYDNIGTKIVGGEVSNEHYWPWIAGLLDENDAVFCGGSLIEPHHILTAAHCLHPEKM